MSFYVARPCEPTFPCCSQYKGLAFRDLTSSWLNRIAFKTSLPIVGVLSAPSPLSSVYNVPPFPKKIPELLACFSGKVFLEDPWRPSYVLNYREPTGTFVLNVLGKAVDSQRKRLDVVGSVGPWWERPSLEMPLICPLQPFLYPFTPLPMSTMILGSPALPPVNAFYFLLRGCSETEEEEWRILEQCLLCYQASAFRILERLYVGKSSRENKLQIQAHMGKGSCSQRQLRGPWQRLRQAWPWSLMDPTRIFPGPTNAAWSPKEISPSEATMISLYRSCSLQVFSEPTTFVVPVVYALIMARKILRNQTPPPPLISSSSLPCHIAFLLKISWIFWWDIKSQKESLGSRIISQVRRNILLGPGMTLLMAMMGTIFRHFGPRRKMGASMLGKVQDRLHGDGESFFSDSNLCHFYNARVRFLGSRFYA